MKKISLSILAMFLMTLGYSSPLPSPSTDDNLYPVVQKGLWGFIDKTGNLIIPCQFQEVGNFSWGLAPAAIHAPSSDTIRLKWGYINPKGDFGIPPLFEEAADFSDGFAKIKINNLYGFISMMGKTIIKPRYYNADSFSEDWAVVQETKGGPKYFIDEGGQPLSRDKYLDASGFHDGLARISFLTQSISDDSHSSDIKNGFINHKGKIVIKLPYQFVDDFSEGLATVCMDTSKGDKYGYIDKRGKMVIPPKYEIGYAFHEGLAPVMIKDKYGFIDKTGKMVIQPQYNWVKYFSNGIAPVTLKWKWGFIDTKGNWIIKPQFDGSGCCFCDGISQVNIGNKIGYIDRTGKYIWQPQY